MTNEKVIEKIRKLLEMNGRYTIKELKEWTKKCDYEKAVKSMLKTMQDRMR